MPADATATDERSPDLSPGIAKFSAAQAMGLLFALAVVWPLVEVAGAAVAFVLAWAGSSLYLLRKPSASAVIGSGLYAAAGGVVVTPIEAYAPTLFGGTDVGGTTGAAMVVGGARGLLVWVTVCSAIAVAMLVGGRYFKRLAAAREAERGRVRRWRERRTPPRFRRSD